LLSYYEYKQSVAEDFATDWVSLFWCAVKFLFIPKL